MNKKLLSIIACSTILVVGLVYATTNESNDEDSQSSKSQLIEIPNSKNGNDKDAETEKKDMINSWRTNESNAVSVFD